ncbi:hypothetical protein [Massilia sp. TSP1-1-2]|uniref:hypothetical protein n=1 Tax=unclassified Massilia TaxID=2609279 RepID=UPI003CE884CA
MNSTSGNDQRTLGSNLLRLLAGTAAVLMLPLVAMQFSSEVNWSLSDFSVMAALLAGSGLIYVAVARQLRSAGQRALVGAGLVLAVLLVWVALAVGVFGTPFAVS